MTSHAIDKIQCSGDVVGIIFHRFMHRFPDRLQSGKMNHRIDLLILKNLIQARLVQDIPLHK